MTEISMKVKSDTKALDAMVKGIDTRTTAGLKNAGFDVEAEAKQRAPVLTGALKNSINTEPMDKMTVHVQDGVNYGIYQELGTSKMKAQPFMIPALELIAGRIQKYFSHLFTVSASVSVWRGDE